MAAQANQIAVIARQQAGIAAKMEAQLGTNNASGGRAAMPFSEIETTALEIGNRLAGLDMHLSALR